MTLTNDEMTAKLHEIKADAAVVAALENAETTEQVQNVLASKGIDLTMEETDALIQIAANSEANEELSEDALDAVSGGAININLGKNWGKNLVNVGIGFVNLGIRLGNAALRNNAKRIKYL